ncbi:hypothetical protein BC833DRAFT_577609 [Globomyces pollinis-pini]|nr:hypothetical protein BC833DRAFT_577609 [Globomyces pollinis-pini]
MKVTLEEYMVNCFIKHQDQFPHTNIREVKDCSSTFGFYLPAFNLTCTRDLRQARKILMQGYKNFSITEKELLDLCFPKSLGPFGDLYLKTMLPTRPIIKHPLNKDKLKLSILPSVGVNEKENVKISNDSNGDSKNAKDSDTDINETNTDKKESVPFPTVPFDIKAATAKDSIPPAV